MGYEDTMFKEIPTELKFLKIQAGPEPFNGYNLPGIPNKFIGDYFGENLNSALDLDIPSHGEPSMKKGTKWQNKSKDSNEKIDSYKTQVNGLGSGTWLSVDRKSIQISSSPGNSTNRSPPNDTERYSTQALDTLKQGDQLDIYGTDGLPMRKQGNESNSTLQDGLDSSKLDQDLGDMDVSLEAGGVESPVELMTSPLMNATDHKGNSTERSTNYGTHSTIYEPEDMKSSKYTATDIRPQSIINGSISSLQGPLDVGIDDSDLPTFVQGPEEIRAHYSASHRSNSTNSVMMGGNVTSNELIKYSNATTSPQSTMISTTKEYSDGKLISNTTKKAALDSTKLVPANLTFPGIQFNGNVSLFEKGDLNPHIPLVTTSKIKIPQMSLYSNTSTASNLNSTSKNHLSASKLEGSLNFTPKANLILSSNDTNGKVTNQNASSHRNKSTHNQSMTINSDIFHTPVNQMAQVLGDGQRHNTSKINVTQSSQRKIKSNSDIMNATGFMTSKTSHVATNSSSLAKSNVTHTNGEKLGKQSSSSGIMPSRFRPVIKEDLNPFFPATNPIDPNHEKNSDLIGTRFHGSVTPTEIYEGYKKDSHPTGSITSTDTVNSEDPPTFLNSIPRVTTPRFGGSTPISAFPGNETDLNRDASMRDTSLMGGKYRAFYPQYPPAIKTPKYVKTQQVQAVSVGLSFSVGFFFLAVLGMVVERKRKMQALNKRSLDHQKFKQDLERYGGYFNSRLFSNQESEIGSLKEGNRDSRSCSVKSISHPTPVITKRHSMNSYAEIGRDSLRSYTSNLLGHSSRRDSYASSFGNVNEEDLAEFNETYGSRPQSLDYNSRDFEFPSGDPVLPEINQDRIHLEENFNDETERFPTSPDLEHDQFVLIKPPPRTYDSKTNYSSQIILDRFLEDLSGLQWQESASIIVAYDPRRRPS
ncbi:uncharacterized protein MELLADRAFT_88895 [Melampsora larici-populina 98AG31]|uniref:Uncharacterized protein n=1 Tax=Melampsora larici-populina (strain 98AG31 / pathotype 3-4-7) TaxID=747676 RepID=F4R667_MELLP|nr:uncharacterized protein MELLADRAFT_88895 [Melampsora larici-populina 98AG31]EGG11832.1 hypothetical protein MELLADRAFT_88895 [Melampsora larici-populina 98AG31]